METDNNLIDPRLKDFRFFVAALWKALGLRPPTRIQYDIATYLMKGPRRRVIEAFRGVGKSWITAAYVLWRLLLNPNERILVVSASKERADAFAIFVKRLINEIPFLKHLAPKPGQRDSTLAFDVAGSMPHQAPSVKSVGITGQIAGSRASIIVADDVEVPKNSMTHTQRERLSEAVKEFDAVLMTDEDLAQLGLPPGEINYLGTPQCEMSLYNLLPARGYRVRIWPARYPKAAQRKAYGDRLAPIISKALDSLEAVEWEPTDPQRFTEEDLWDREMSYGRSGFAMQFMLDTSFSDGDRFPLKLNDLIVMALGGQDMAPAKVVWGSGPEQTIEEFAGIGLAGDRLNRPMFYTKDDFMPYQGMVMSIDPSGRGGDELAYAIVGMLNGFLYVLTCKGLTGGYSDENLQKLADEAKRFKVKQIIIEENFGDGMFSKLLTPFMVRTYPCTMEEVKHSIQKEKRIIDTLEPVMNQHRLVVDEALLRSDMEDYNDYGDEQFRKYCLFYQMTRLTKERQSLAKDDRLDSLAIAIAYWVEQMDKDTQQIENERRAEALDRELNTFMEGVLGYSSQGSSWM